MEINWSIFDIQQGRQALFFLAVYALGQAALAEEHARISREGGCATVIECTDPEDLPGEHHGGGHPNRAPSITIGSSTSPGVSVDVPSSVFVSVGPQAYVDVPASVFRSAAS